MGDAEQFSLRWNNFHSNLSSGFQSLLAEEDLIDVTLAAGGGVVQAHKIILSICSPYFKQIFKTNPCKHPIVILKDVHYKDLVDILQFMYQGEVNVRQEDLGTFLKTAELLQIKGLTGQDSPAEIPVEREAPVQNSLDHTFPRIRPPRRRIEKPPHPTLPRVDKQPSPRVPSPLPPYKRMRGDTPTSRSPIVSSDDASGIEFIDLKSPKREPVDYEAVSDPLPSTEGTGNGESAVDNIMARESSSHSLHESTQGITSEPEITEDSPGLLKPKPTVPSDIKAIRPTPSISGSVLDTNTGQDGEPGSPQFVESRKGKLQLVMGGFIYNLINPRERRQYWRCTEYSKKGCRGHVTMVENQVVSLSPQPHNHEPLHERIRLKMEMTRIKQQFQLEKHYLHPQINSPSIRVVQNYESIL